jgi:hypothetical protein
LRERDVVDKAEIRKEIMDYGGEMDPNERPQIPTISMRWNGEVGESMLSSPDIPSTPCRMHRRRGPLLHPHISARVEAQPIKRVVKRLILDVDWCAMQRITHLINNVELSENVG